MKQYLNLIIAAFACFIAFAITSLYYQNKILGIKNKQEQDKIALLETQNKINQDYLNLQTKVKEKEKEDYEKFTKLQDDNEKLLSDIADSKRRLRIKVSSCSSASAQAGTTSMDDGEASRAVIDSGDAQSIIAITKKADKYKSQLEALQNYIDTYNSNIK